MSSKMMGCTLILACICFLALLSTQCGRNKDQAQRDASTVTVYTDEDERLLGPFGGGTAQFCMFCNLWNLTKEGIPEPRLAERWEHSGDCRTWTFWLRQDVRWHDGVTFTAYDVKFSLELFAHPDVLNGDDLWLNMESVTVLDDFTFTITYTQPRCGYPDDWNIFYPKHLLEDLDPKEFYSWDFWTHPIGNGPFRYVRHVPKIMMELEANPNYYRGKPKIERLVFKLGGGDPLIELLSGNVDVVKNFDENDIPKLRADGRFHVYQEYSPWWLYAIYWNHRHPLFGDSKVRRALTMAINRRELVQVMNLPENAPIFDTIWAGPVSEIPEPLPYDPERAKQLLDEAGWRDLDGDGIRERDGEKAQFTALASAEETVTAAIYVQAQLLRVGIKMEIRTLANAVLRVRLRAGEFEAAFAGFENSGRGMLRAKWFSPDSPIGYSNPKIIKLLQYASKIRVSDHEAVDKIYRELMAIFCEKIPITFLYMGVDTMVAHKRIHPSSGDWGWGYEDAWLEEDEK